MRSVIDGRTEQPIRDVLVYVEGLATIEKTDTDGRFAMMVPRGRQTVMASVRQADSWWSFERWAA
jgi:hypothetical protein